MKYILLPLEKSIDLFPKVFNEKGILSAISEFAGVFSDSVSLFFQDSEKNVLKRISSFNPDLEVLYILIHYRGGGKGGFRKQLEKKAREFTRAKRKEKTTHKANNQGQETKIKEKIKLPEEHPKSALPTQRGVSCNRELARQGVNYILAKYSE